MSTQSYFDRNTVAKVTDKDVTRLAQKLAPGHPPELQPRPGAENKTPSPVTTAGDLRQIVKDRAWGRAGDRPEDQNPGKNGFGLASSLPPGQKAAPATIDPHGPAGMDPVLKNLVMGTARAIDGEDSWQTRPDYNDRAQKVPTTFGHHKPGGDGVVPTKMGGSPMADEMARRTAGLKRTTETGK